MAAIGHFNPTFTINVLSRRPDVWQKEITAHTKGSAWENKGALKGVINVASSAAQDVVPEADIILICSPAHTKMEILTKINQHIKKGALVGTVFGQGAFDL